MRRSLRFALVAGCFAAAPAAWSESADERQSYSYVRTLDGRATLASVGRGPGEEADLHSPLMQGDRISVERDARVEVALADRNLLRLGSDAAVVLARVAYSADRDDRTTRLDLDQGEALLVVTDQALGDDLPELRTPGGTVFIHQPGTYRIRADEGGGVELVVREGYAELLTDRGSTVVRAGEAAWTTGDRWRPVEVGGAGGLSDLERWGEGLDQSVRAAAGRTLHVEPGLATAAEPLDNYGSWVYVDTSWYWQPRVAAGWRPYWQGRWGWTPSGLTWISSEPWGWLPYHYGSWSFLAGRGWGWRPGRVYSPAWVYWYIGSGWSGWCPVGYYTDYYRSHWAGGFRYGVYGWAGGSWGFYADWNFLPTPRLCARDAGNWRRRGFDLARTEGPVVPRGVLTTDTRDLPRGRWERPDELVRTLARSPHGGRADGNLPEVTDFVARRRDLPADVARAVERTPTDPAPRRATPLDPEMERRPRHEDPVTSAGWRARAAERPGSSDRRNAIENQRPDLPQPGRSERVAPTASSRSWRDADQPGSTPPQPRAGQPLPRVEMPANGDRQGWKLRGGWSDRPAVERAQPGDADPPVRRVVDGVRRVSPAGELPTADRRMPVDREPGRDGNDGLLRFREVTPGDGEARPTWPIGERRWVLPPGAGDRSDARGPSTIRSQPTLPPITRRIAPPSSTGAPAPAPRAPQAGAPPAGSRATVGRSPSSPQPSAQGGRGNRSPSKPTPPPPPPPRGRGDARGHD